MYSPTQPLASTFFFVVVKLNQTKSIDFTLIHTQQMDNELMSWFQERSGKLENLSFNLDTVYYN